MIKFGLFLLLLIKCQLFINSSKPFTCDSANANDDFCDCGTDEDLTSACSGITGSKTFKCRGSRFLNESIYLSRVQDGVCDCCDGSDESESKFGVFCENTCDQKLDQIKQETLQLHQKILTGLNAKNDIVTAYHREKSRKEAEQAKSSPTEAATPKEYEELKKMLLNLRSRVDLEEREESSLRLDYIQKRIRKCSDGYEEFCDIFKDKLRSSAGTASTSETSSNDNKIHNKLNSIHEARCPHKEVLIDLNTRIVETVSDYLKLKPAKPSLKAQAIRKKTLFSKYLDNGTEGHLMGLQTITEWLGILTSPMLLPLHLFYFGGGYLYDSVLKYLQHCGGVTDSDAPARCLPFVQNIMQQLNNESSELSTYYVLLDYTRYAWYNTIENTLQPVLAPIFKYSYIFLYSPYIFGRYYFFPSSYMALPPKREACILRTGINRTLEYIRQYQTYQNDLKKEEKFKQLKEETKKSVDIPYDKEHPWEALVDVCVETQYRQYLYKLCLFKDCYQDNTLLGTFRGWGNTSSYTNDALERDSNKKLSWQRSIGSVFGSGSDSNSDKRPSEEKYSQQTYNNGWACVGGKERMVTVNLQCGITTEIEEVVEVEICVYEMRVNTPIACTKHMEEASRAKLVELGVFGFDERRDSHRKESIPMNTPKLEL